MIGSEDFESGGIPVDSKVMLRKTFVVSKEVITKQYGTLRPESFAKYHRAFCRYFECGT